MESSSPTPLPGYAIGVINYRSYPQLERCLAAIGALADAPRATIVLDVEAEPGESARLSAAQPDVRWLRRPNRGYSGAANEVLRQARAEAGVEFVLVMNADVELERDAPREMLAELAARPEVAIASGKLLRPDGSIDSAGIVLPRNRRPRDRGAGEADRGQYERVERVFGASGAAMWLRVAALDALAVEGEHFDEDFFLYHEDTDLSWRANRLGFSVLYVPASRAEHERHWRAEKRFEIAVSVRRHSFKNHYLQMIKNERARDFWRDVPVILGWEVARFGFALLRDREMFGAYREAWRCVPGARRKRKALAARASGPTPIGYDAFSPDGAG